VEEAMIYLWGLDSLSVKITMYFDLNQAAANILINYHKKSTKLLSKEIIISYCAKSSFIPVKITAEYIAFSIKFDNDEYFRYWDEATWCDPFPEPSFKLIKPPKLEIESKSKPDQVVQDNSQMNPKLLTQITKWNSAGQQSDQEIFKVLFI
jgi:hypothetical protein